MDSMHLHLDASNTIFVELEIIQWSMVYFYCGILVGCTAILSKPVLLVP
jgi:hypothetical protein